MQDLTPMLEGKKDKAKNAVAVKGLKKAAGKVG
jgi:hypothetical protein